MDSARMRYALDTEFIDDGNTIDLISLALVADDGAELSVQSVEFDEDHASPWVKEHVIEQLVMCPCCGHWANHEHGKCRHNECPWRTRAQIRHDVLEFIGPRIPQFWSWCGAYDYVALCQLFGTMLDIPSHWPHTICDIQYDLDALGIADVDLPQQQGDLHNALSDARYIRTLWQYLHIEHGFDVFRLRSRVQELEEQVQRLQAKSNTVILSDLASVGIIKHLSASGAKSVLRSLRNRAREALGYTWMQND